MTPRPLTDEELAQLGALQRKQDEWDRHCRMPVVELVNEYVNRYSNTLGVNSDTLLKWMLDRAGSIINRLRPFNDERRKLYIVQLGKGRPELCTEEELPLTLRARMSDRLEVGDYFSHDGYRVTCVVEPQ